MKYEVRLFASLREAAGRDVWECEAPHPVSGTELMGRFFEAFPAMARLRRVTRLAVNQAFLAEDRELNAADELALIPPVSGG